MFLIFVSLLSLGVLVHSLPTWTNETAAQTNFAVAPSIINGEEASKGEFPFIVSLTRIGKNDRRLFFCGGSIIASNVVLTAGHCLIKYIGNPDDIDVYAGHHEKDDVNDVQIITVKEAIVHPQFYLSDEDDPFDIEYDVAVAILEADFQFSSNVQPIMLPQNNDDQFYGLQGTAAGWGVYKDPKKQPNVLQKIQLVTTNNEYCQERMNSEVIVRDMEICAENDSFGGTCSGDSGGPFVIKRNGSWLQIGLTSWGKGCIRGQYPSVFARTGWHARWISEQLSF